MLKDENDFFKEDNLVPGLNFSQLGDSELKTSELEVYKQAEHKRHTEIDLNKKAYYLAFSTLAVILIMYFVDSFLGTDVADNLFSHLFGVLTLIIGFLFGSSKR